jgi:hypothetical protein
VSQFAARPGGAPPRFALVYEPYTVVIRDVERNMNVFFLAEGGHGVHSNTTRLAEAVVEFLNTMPEDFLR